MSDRHVFRAAVEARDHAAMRGCFRDDAVLHSPVSFKPFEGKEAIAGLFSILLEVFDDFRYTDQLEAPDGTLGLVFRARVGERDVQGIDLVRFDPEGRVVDFTVMVRPRSALETLFEAVGSRLAGKR
jgi:hypothetical protein